MVAPLAFLIAGSLVIPLAKRVKILPALGVVPHTMTGRITVPALMTRTPFNSSFPRMQVAAPPDDEIPWTNARWQSKVSGSWISDQKYPITINGIDSKKLLDTWFWLFMNAIQKQVKPTSRWQAMKQMFFRTGHGVLTYIQSSLDKAVVLHNMRDLVGEATTILKEPDAKTINGSSSLTNQLSQSTRLEIIALLPKDFLESRTCVVDASVLALGIVRRESLSDDRKGSLRRRVEQQRAKRGLLGLQWKEPSKGQPQMPLDVFTIEGLVHAPGLSLKSEDSLMSQVWRSEKLAMALLSKIEKYAYHETRIVVLSKQAYATNDGTDLTEYYVRLGFEKVKMKGRRHELVYTGGSFTGKSAAAEDVGVEMQHIMVGVNLQKSFDDVIM